MNKSSELTLWLGVAPGLGFAQNLDETRCDVKIRPSFIGIHHVKTGNPPSAQCWATLHDTSVSGRVSLSMDTPRRDVAGHTLSKECKKQAPRSWSQRAWSSALVVAQENPMKVSTSLYSSRFKVHRLCHPVLSQQEMCRLIPRQPRD